MEGQNRSSEAHSSIQVSKRMSDYNTSKKGSVQPGDNRATETPNVNKSGQYLANTATHDKEHGQPQGKKKTSRADSQKVETQNALGRGD